MNAKAKLLEAALQVIRERGYSATTVDELCRAAGVTKGAFFHHFPTKEALAVAAADHWSELTGGFFATAPYHELSDPPFGFICTVHELDAKIGGTHRMSFRNFTTNDSSCAATSPNCSTTLTRNQRRSDQQGRHPVQAMGQRPSVSVKDSPSNIEKALIGRLVYPGSPVGDRGRSCTK